MFDEVDSAVSNVADNHATDKTVIPHASDRILRANLDFLNDYLDDPSVNELCINRPKEIFVERAGKWTLYKRDNLSLMLLRRIATSVAASCEVIGKLDDSNPIGSGSLPGNYRVQFVLPPAVEKGFMSITIRKPTPKELSLDDLAKGDFFSRIVPRVDRISDTDKLLVALREEKRYKAFFEVAIQARKTILTCGETGSGKTTFMKALAQQIDATERLITIEDTRELFLPNHRNKVHLLYSREAKENDPVTPKTLLESCMRMRPDRIFLAETRGGEAYDLLNVMLSGHEGTITSMHAGSPERAFARLAQLAASNPSASTMSHELLVTLFKSVIDIVVHQEHRGGYHITEIYFDPYRMKGLQQGDVRKDVEESKKAFPKYFN